MHLVRILICWKDAPRGRGLEGPEKSIDGGADYFGILISKTDQDLVRVRVIYT